MRPTPGRSRIKGLRALLLRLIRDHQHAAKCVEFRHDLPAEQLAVAARCAERLAACLDDLRALNLPPDPREARRVKKRALL